MVYKLSINKTQSGNYQLTTYHKVEPEELPDFAAVVNRMIELYRSGLESREVWLEEPTLAYLSENEQRAVGDLWFTLARLGRLEDIVKDQKSDDIPF
jgi:hypothetical protein